MKNKNIFNSKLLISGLIATCAIIIIQGTAPVSGQTQKNVKEEKTKVGVTNHSFNGKFKAITFYSGLVDDKNTKWFLTEAGIVSFNNQKWIINSKNKKVPTGNLKDFAYGSSPSGSELWIASPSGIIEASLPIAGRSGVNTYNTENTTLKTNNILDVAIGKGPIRWFGTDKGISAFENAKWLSNAYQRTYPEGLFKNFPITAMATNRSGDSLYVATDGAGVARIFKDKVDAISGASEYAQWGPIDMPSDKVYSICITPDGTQWFGTDMGIARHTGFNTLKNWTVFNKEDGLVDSFVKAIAIDNKGSLWFGTKGGVSVYDGSAWRSYTVNDGLSSNNILCIIVDKKGVIWLGTDNGVMSFSNGEFVCYR